MKIPFLKHAPIKLSTGAKSNMASWLACVALAGAVFTSASALAAAKSKTNLRDDFASLGDNQDVVDRAQSLNVDKKVQVVQNRIVDRNLRFELGLSYGGLSGGDSYIRTQNLGGHADFHINPRWSIGARYYHSYNTLTNEGREMYDNAQAMQDRFGVNTNYQVPQIDAPKDTVLGVINWYPFYGKLNFFDLGVAHFDFYLLVGAGKMTLQSGNSDVYSGGGGIGFWWTQHFTTRIEVTYQSYKDLIGTYNRQQSATQGIVSLGVML